MDSGLSLKPLDQASRPLHKGLAARPNSNQPHAWRRTLHDGRRTPHEAPSTGHGNGDQTGQADDAKAMDDDEDGRRLLPQTSTHAASASTERKVENGARCCWSVPSCCRQWW